MELEHEMCAFAVAVAFSRHVTTLVNINYLYSPLQLATEVNSLPYGTKADFYITPEALAHGLNRFKKGTLKLMIDHESCSHRILEKTTFIQSKCKEMIMPRSWSKKIH